MQKMPPETDGFWTSFCVQELLPKFRRSRESAFFYSRCRYIGWLKGLTTLPSENSSPQSHCHSEETAEVPPVADTARRFQESVPVFMPQRGWKSADTTVKAFCCCWQKVCRRRQKTLCEKETRRRHKKENADGNSEPVGDSKEKLQRVLRIATGAVRPRNGKKCVIASAFT